MGWLNCFLKLGMSPVPAIKINFFQYQDACQRLMYVPTYIHHCLKKAAKTKMLSVVRIQQKEYLVLCTVTSRLLLSIYCLPSTKYLTSTKTVVSCFLFIIIIINLFRRVFSVYTEANATSLIPLDTILPEIYSFIIGFSFTVWTKMRLLAGS